MRKLLVLFIFALLCHSSAKAQWYERSCGVVEPDSATSDEFECLWNRADRIAEVGMRTCGIGTGITVLGGVTIFVSAGSSAESSSGYSMIGATGVICGLVVVAVSIPIWTVGASRRSKLRNSPAYEDFQPATLQITPLIENNLFNSQACLGLTASLNF